MAEQKLKNAHSLKELLSSMTVPEDHELVLRRQITLHLYTFGPRQRKCLRSH